MRKLWEFLWDGCWHRWLPKERVSVYNSNNTDKSLPSGNKYVYQCCKCFKIKFYKDY